MAEELGVRHVPGYAPLGTVEIHGVGAGDFRADLWESGKLHFVPDHRMPLLAPLMSGVYRNIYAPSAVEVEDGWRLFYGAWDGINVGHDCIYSVMTKDFIDFTDRRTVISHGEFHHVCNVNALRLPNGEYRMMCTAYPDKHGQNKPAFFSSPDGVTWNGKPEPYPATMADLVTIRGYDKFQEADINGMNVILYEDGFYRLYFNNFRSFGNIYRASSRDGRDFEFDGPVLEFRACVNDVKKLTHEGKIHYLMGLHMNGNTLWYSLSSDGMKFGEVRELATNLGDADRFIVAIGWVTQGNRLLGFLYGAGAVPSLDRNRIWGRWLQKKVAFVAEDGTVYEPSSALGPDRQLIQVPGEVAGHFVIYEEDGETVIADNIPSRLIPGAIYRLSEKE